MRRRILAIALLIAFGSPLIVPIVAATADPESQPPACCRRHGKHHCSMTMAQMAMMAADGGPALTTPPCPLYPTAATLPQFVTGTLNAPPQLSAEPARTDAPPLVAPQRAWTFSPSANRMRGPPDLTA